MPKKSPAAKAGTMIKEVKESGEAALRATQKTAEKAFEQTTETMTKAYDQAFSATQHQLQKTFPKAAEGFDRLVTFQRDNVEAWLAASQSAMKAMEKLSGEVWAFNVKSMEEGLAGAQKLFGCKTLPEAVELHSDLARSQFEAMLAQGSKLSDLAMKLANEVAEPIQVRVNRAVELIGRPFAA